MWGVLAAAGLGAAANIFGAFRGRSAANAAANTQAGAAGEAAEDAARMPDIVNPRIAEAFANAQHGLSTVANRSADTIEQRARQSYEDVMGQTREANAYLDPYSSTGQAANERLSALAGIGGDPASALALDPGYQFRLSEGQKALEKSAAARGGILGGGTLKALARYAQGAASQEYGSAFQRLSSLADRGFTAANTQGNRLISGAEYGGTLGTNAAVSAGGMRTNAAQQEGQWGVQSGLVQGQNTIDASREARDYRIQRANALASGIVGSANAFTQGIAGAAGAIGGGLSLLDLAGRKGGGGGGNPSLPSPQGWANPSYMNWGSMAPSGNPSLPSAQGWANPSYMNWGSMAPSSPYAGMNGQY